MNITLRTQLIPIFTLITLIALACSARSEDKIELKTIKIKGNKELPKILYVVPWRETKNSGKGDQKLQLHDFFGDLYDPVTPEPPKTALEYQAYSNAPVPLP